MTSVLSDVKERVTMNTDLFLIIDMQNAYDQKGVWACENIEQAKNNIIKVLDSKKEKNVIFTQFVAPSSPQGKWKLYNQLNKEVNEDVVANDIMDIYKPYLETYPVYTKSTYSSMTNMDVLQACQNAKRVVLSGVVSECCVLATALALIDLGIEVVFLKDAVAGINSETERATELILAGLEYAHVSLINTKEYLGKEERR